MTAPSAGVGGRTTAFVPGNAPFLRKRSAASTIGTASTSLLSSSASAEDSFYQGTDQSQQSMQPPTQRRRPRPDEPNLFDIPAEFHPTYLPMPMLLQLSIAVASALTVGRGFVSRLVASSSTFAQLLQLLAKPLAGRLLSFSAVRSAASFLLKTALLFTIAKLAVQERFFPPSRVTTAQLAERGELPSTLSRYEVVTPVPFSHSNIEGKEVTVSSSSWDTEGVGVGAPLGVHSIQYTQQNALSDSKVKYDGIYLHHGFGASSLSWLPALPSLVDRFGVGKGKSVGVAHDAPGFGFTDRPDADAEGGLEQYGFENNVGIGLSLLKNLLPDDATSEARSIAIFGHSMGSKAALLMALHCASRRHLGLRPSLVVLVAPALEGVALPSRKAYLGSKLKKHSRGWMRKLARRAWIAWRKIFLDYPFRYGLRRLVSGSKDFWRQGLTLAWGEPSRLSDSDVLRFKWPSIGKGWEKGLINFSRSRMLSSPSHSAALNDGHLLQEVAKLKDTKVVIVYGSKDGVVRIEGPVADALKQNYPGVKVVRMEGLGHDPFEEDVGGFLAALEKALEE
ncbi:hypothetical protein ACHAXT_013146 [Thalassiosira profunda]